MNDHIAKPVNPDNLYASIAKWLPVLPERQAIKHTPPPVPPAGDERATLEAQGWVDMEQAMCAVRNNINTYRRLLNSFIDGHGRDDEILESACQENRLQDARHLAHNLKGVAGTLGLWRIHASACALNDALLPGAPDNDPAPLFADLVDALQYTCSGILAYQKEHPSTP